MSHQKVLYNVSMRWQSLGPWKLGKLTSILHCMNPEILGLVSVSLLLVMGFNKTLKHYRIVLFEQSSDAFTIGSFILHVL